MSMDKFYRYIAKIIINTLYLSLVLIFFGLIPQHIFAAPRNYAFDIVDHVEVRNAIKDEIFAPINLLSQRSPTIIESTNGAGIVQIRYIERDNFLYATIIPRVHANFALDNAGTYIIKRSKKTGGVEHIKIFLNRNPQVYLMVRSAINTNASVLSVTFANTILHQNIVIPLSIEEIVLLPLEQILDVSSFYIDWEMLLIRPTYSTYTPIRAVIETIRPLLSTLPDAENGAMDSNGNLVFIDSGTIRNEGGGFNCSGFSKWVSDGLFYPLSGAYLPIQRLNTKQHHRRGTSFSALLEAKRDPYFGLDWSRALARELYRARFTVSAQMAEQNIDVRSIPYTHYIENVGYSVAELKYILYFLAIHEPNTLYIASVNNEFDASPTLRQHFHIALFFPYITRAGNFEVVVMERNYETSFDQFIAKNITNDVHLVRMFADSDFLPPQIAHNITRIP